MNEKIIDTYISVNDQNKQCNFANKWLKKLISILVSTRLTAFLFISFSLAMAIGTFIESFYGTDASKILVYNATWFEVMMLLFVVNFAYNIKRYSLLEKRN